MDVEEAVKKLEHHKSIPDKIVDNNDPKKKLTQLKKQLEMNRASSQDQGLSKVKMESNGKDTLDSQCGDTAPLPKSQISGQFLLTHNASGEESDGLIK